MALNDALAQRQAYADAGVVFPRMQPLEDIEHALLLFRIDADALIGNGEQPKLTLRLGLDPQSWRSGAMKLQGIPQQVLEQLQQTLRISAHQGQLSHLQLSCSLLYDRGVARLHSL